MVQPLSRRDFLKLSSLIPLSYLVHKTGQVGAEPGVPNVLIIVFDALSALNMSLHGYVRDTTPNLSRLAERATVYHNHFSSGNFTTPGVASLLTGTYPWTHRAIKLVGTVARNLTNRNIFNLFDGYHTLAYTHNELADTILRQFHEGLQVHIPIEDFYLAKDSLTSRLLINDYDTASLSRFQILNDNDGVTNSLFFSRFYNAVQNVQRKRVMQDLTDLFPRGLPSRFSISDQFYILEDAIDGMIEHQELFQTPFLGYYHFLPPHEPYRTRSEFVDRFNDGWEPVRKPLHFFKTPGFSFKKASQERRFYDEYIPYVDEEFNRLFEALSHSGLLDNTWLVLTSDHGEMFERGEIGHEMRYLHQPLVRIPLLVFQPGQTDRRDVYTPTSAVDLLPTLLWVAGKQIPDWCEGQILPPFNPTEPDPDRSVFALEARDNPKPGVPISVATAMIVKGRYKLIYYYGYQMYPGSYPSFELFDIQNDPEELENLYSQDNSIAGELLHELKGKADKPYLDNA
jgi:arylsulfatase A-like enzyme